MRVFIAGLLGGIVYFVWGAIAHTVLPIGEMGQKAPVNEEVVIAALKDGLGGEGVYILPNLTPEQMKDEAALKDYSARAVANPYGFVVYQPVGTDLTQMGRNLGIQFASSWLSAWVIAFVLALGAFGFQRRVLVSGALGLFAWLTISVPYWNWFRFPMDFTVANLLEQVLGWAIAGAAMAWWLGRGGR